MPVRPHRSIDPLGSYSFMDFLLKIGLFLGFLHDPTLKDTLRYSYLSLGVIVDLLWSINLWFEYKIYLQKIYRC